MSARFLLPFAAFAALTTLAAVPGRAQAAYAGNISQEVPIPPPPICGAPDVRPLPGTCDMGKRADYYPKSDCPPETPPNGWVVCQPPQTAPIVGMECLSLDGFFECRGLPGSIDQGLTYSWAGGTLFTIYQPDGNRSPLAYVTCRRANGTGSVTLTVTTAQGVSKSFTQSLDCLL